MVRLYRYRSQNRIQYFCRRNGKIVVCSCGQPTTPGSNNFVRESTPSTMSISSEKKSKKRQLENTDSSSRSKKEKKRKKKSKEKKQNKKQKRKRGADTNHDVVNTDSSPPRSSIPILESHDSQESITHQTLPSPPPSFAPETPRPLVESSALPPGVAKGEHLSTSLLLFYQYIDQTQHRLLSC